MSKQAGAAPEHGAKHFVCPHCGVAAQMRWASAKIPHSGSSIDEKLRRATCTNCGDSTYWVDSELAWPKAPFGESPNSGLEGELLELYEEARAIAARSPRGACALLRLLIERLVVHVGGEGKTLYDRIGDLAERRIIPAHVVDALDSVRVVANGAVHDGIIDPNGDDHDVVLMLLAIVNAITEAAITIPKRTRELLGGKRRGQVPE